MLALPETKDYLASLTAATSGLSPLRRSDNQYSQLLIESTAILERARDTRRMYEAMAERAFAAWIALAEALDLDDIQRERVGAGGLKLPGAEAVSDRDRVKHQRDGAVAQSKNLDLLVAGARAGKIEGADLEVSYSVLAGWAANLAGLAGNTSVAALSSSVRYNADMKNKLEQRVAEDMATFNLRTRLYEYSAQKNAVN